MTPEELDNIENKQAAAMWIGGPTAVFAQDTLLLVKALREARAELGEALDELAFIKEEYGDGDPAEMTADALLLKVKTITLDYNKARAEAERLRGIVEVNDQRLADCWDTARRVLKGRDNDP